ncbi:hypothetical protein Pcinc_038793 [Petrolisthes cinctipes]|uniref:C2H2-type domain-containing protein n=1 Tax=Petrolisthes cinctipes TaxID=88211 RepID=A0AAE1BR27_PETCI|nr:hypothetical protein Pcinc_038793 [Petrolisthes cinctipes]
MDGDAVETTPTIYIKQEPPEASIKIKEEQETTEEEEDEDDDDEYDKLHDIKSGRMAAETEMEEDDDGLDFMEDEEGGDGEEEDEEEEGKLNDLECGLCGRGYSCLSALRGHLSRQHRVGSGGYRCEVCGAVASTKASFKRHLLRTHGQDTLAQYQFLIKCRHCGEGVTTLPLLYQHINLHHPDEAVTQYYRCTHCPVLYSTRQALTRHFRRRHKGEPLPPCEPLPCPDCGVELPTSAALREHRRCCPKAPTYPSDSAKRRFKCDHCPSAFVFKSSLVRHAKKMHQNQPRPRNFPCSECGKVYRHKGRLERHINSHHTNATLHTLFPCPICNKTFTTYEKRKGHQRRAHRDRSMWQCGECHRSFHTADELDVHRHMRHKGTCPVCGKVFLRRDSLREHLLIHNGPRLPCPHCSKTFTQGSNLKRHIRIHTGEKPFKCTYCHKPFGDRSACKSHMLVHTGEGRCSCPTCGATFSKRQKLNYHMRLHTGEGLLHCPLCSRPATNTYDLKKHLESHQVALLTALRSSLTYTEVEDLPDLALKALHNLVWVAVQNSGRAKPGDKQAGVIGEQTTILFNDLKEQQQHKSGETAERTDWARVDDTKIKVEPTEESYQVPDELPNQRKRGKSRKTRDTAIDPLVAKEVVDLKLEQQKLGLEAKVIGDGESNGKSSSGSGFEYNLGSDSEELENYPLSYFKSKFKKLKTNGNKSPHKSKGLKGIIKREPPTSTNGYGSNDEAKNQTITDTEENRTKNERRIPPMPDNAENKKTSPTINTENDKTPPTNIAEDESERTPPTVHETTMEPLAVLTQVMNFILGSVGCLANAASPDNSEAAPTLGDELVERCLEVIMKDGGEEGSEEEEVVECSGGEESEGEDLEECCDEREEEWNDGKKKEEECSDGEGEECNDGKKEEEEEECTGNYYRKEEECSDGDGRKEEEEEEEEVEWSDKKEEKCSDGEEDDGNIEEEEEECGDEEEECEEEEEYGEEEEECNEEEDEECNEEEEEEEYGEGETEDGFLDESKDDGDVMESESDISKEEREGMKNELDESKEESTSDDSDRMETEINGLKKVGLKV